MLGLRFCARALSSCGERGPLLIVVHGPLTVTASPAVEHRLQTCRLSSCGPWAHPLCGMWDPPRPWHEPMSPALAGGLPTTAPPGKPLPLSLVIVCYLNIFSHIFIITHVLFCLFPFMWNLFPFLNFFTFSLFVPLKLEWVLFKQHRVGYFFIHSTTLCLLIDKFIFVHLKVIIDKLCTYCCHIIVFWLFCSSFLPLCLPLWFIDFP